MQCNWSFLDNYAFLDDWNPAGTLRLHHPAWRPCLSAMRYTCLSPAIFLARLPADSCVHHHASPLPAAQQTLSQCVCATRPWFNLGYLEQRKIQNLNTAKESLQEGIWGRGGLSVTGSGNTQCCGATLGIQNKIEASPCPQGASV